MFAGYDVRTGRRKWIFHTVPRPGEFGLDTWLNDSWSYTGNTGAWGEISIDEARGLAYIGVEEPTGDFYGGPRPGNNLFGESLVAVDLETGERRWYKQFVHHGKSFGTTTIPRRRSWPMSRLRASELLSWRSPANRRFCMC